MKFTATPLPGAFLIEPERIEDDRGFFARSFCVSEFAREGLETSVAQCNISYNRRAGTLRGMHYQAAPHEEAKLVRCTMGSLYDVIVDLRPASATYLKTYGVELSAQNRRMLFIPKGMAHGYQTLCDDTEVCYQMFESYHPESARGVRFDDPVLAIRWPLPDPLVSERDRSYPLLSR
jgi:dTDP-4-dehydrorhamnose 3,5-epimerase